MKEKIKRLLPKSEFSKNVLTLLKGTTIAQIIPFAITPILTRMYSPEDFGLLALFVAIVSLFGSIANGRYELAVMLPEKDEEAINIFALGFVISAFISLLLLVIVFFFNHNICAFLKNEKIGFWLNFVPITVFFIGAFNMLKFFNNRKRKYKDISSAIVIKSSVLALIQLVIGSLKSGPVGLLSAEIVSQFSSNLKLLKNIITDKQLLAAINRKQILKQGKRYIRFPKIDLWSILFNVSATQASILLLSNFFTAGIVGLYSFSFKLVSRPSSLIGTSIGQVFYQSSSVLKKDEEEFKQIVVNTYKKLLKIGIIPFSILMFFSDYIFFFFFGGKWVTAGLFSCVLSPWLLVGFIASPLSTVLLTKEKQKTLLFFNILLLLFRIASVLIGGFLFNSIYYTIILFSITGVILYSSLLLHIFKLLNIKLYNILIYSLKYLLFILFFLVLRLIVNLYHQI